MKPTTYTVRRSRALSIIKALRLAEIERLERRLDAEMAKAVKSGEVRQGALCTSSGSICAKKPHTGRPFGCRSR